MRWWLPLATLLAVISVGGCARDLPLSLTPDSPAQVADLGGPPNLVELSIEQHRALERWVTNNRSGWSPYYATLPSKGLIVRAGALDLQFLDSTAFARTPQGVFEKSVTPAEYAYLRRTANGT